MSNAVSDVFGLSGQLMLKAPVDEDHDLLFQINPRGRTFKNLEFSAAERERQALMKLAC